MEIMFTDVITKRDNNTHKGSYGRLLCVCGSYGMAGAAVLCSKAALRSGIGLVDVAVSKDIYPIVASNVHEAIYTIYKDENDLLEAISLASTIVIGCGLGKKALPILKTVLKYSKVPIIIDADGLNVLAKSNINLKEYDIPIIITPHPKEMARLTNLSVEKIAENRIKIAREYAYNNQVIVVLKGYNTVVAAPSGKTYINETGNPGMATGGSGDVLAGMIGALITNSSEIHQAVCATVYFHGLAGDLAAKDLSMTAMLPSDLINYLPTIFKKIEKE